MNNINWIEIKKRIKQELKKSAKNHPDIFSNENIQLFEKVVSFDINSTETSLDGVASRMSNSFQKILVDGISKDDTLSYFPDFAKIEPFLKKILFIVNKEKYNDLILRRKGLAVFIDELGLNHSNIRLDRTNISDSIDQPYFQEHLVRSYHLRNTESHACQDWSSRELYENVESILLIYIYAISLNKEQIKSIVEQQPNVKNYLHEVVTNFEKWQYRFVHIMGKEKFEEIDLYALESDEWIEENDEEAPLREGKIDDLRNSIEENQMVILGDPGMGKSTTLQYLAYKDAKRKIQNCDDRIKTPVFIELKLLSKGESILSVIQTKMKLSVNEVIALLEAGDLSIFLDGLNEVLKEIRKDIRKEIQNIISSYPSIKIIVTSRPLAYSNEFKDVPAFVLQKLDSVQIDEFLEKNCFKENIRVVIREEINLNARFAKIVKVPLMLRMLINVALHNNGHIPLNKVLIIKQFISSLYKRELKKDGVDFDHRVVHRLLCYLGFHSRDLKGSNAGLRIEEVESMLEVRIDNSRFQLSVYDFLDIVLDLNIIVNDNGKYSFIHELYQEYYSSEELYRLKAQELANS